MQHTYEEITADVKQQLSELIGISPDEIGDDDQLVEDLGASSVAIVQLFLNCQEKYDVKLDDELDLLRPLTIREFADKILAGDAAPAEGPAGGQDATPEAKPDEQAGDALS